LARTTITVDGFLAAIARHGATVYLSLIGDADPIARDAMAAVLDHAHLAGNQPASPFESSKSAPSTRNVEQNAAC